MSQPNDQQHQQREQELQAGRNRRAELMLTKQAEEKARQDVLEGRQDVLGQRLTDIENRVAKLEATLASLG